MHAFLSVHSFSLLPVAERPDSAVSSGLRISSRFFHQASRECQAPCASLGHGQPCATWPLLALLLSLVASLFLPSESVRRLPPRLFSSAAGVRVLLRLDFYSQRWLSETDACSEGQRQHLNLSYSLLCSAGLGTVGATAQQQKSRWVIFHLLGTHLYSSATFTAVNKTAGYGYCSQSRAPKFYLMV